MDVIAQRELKFRARGAAEEVSIKVLIGRPFYDPEVDWTCLVQIIDPEIPRKPTPAFGVDAVQALQLALELLPSLLACYEEDGELRGPGVNQPKT